MDDFVSARTRAEELWRAAYSQQLNGELANAIALRAFQFGGELRHNYTI